MLLATATDGMREAAFKEPRIQEKRSFTGHDATALFYRRWSARASRPKGAVVLLHREHEHSGCVQHLVEETDLADFAFFAWDARGHGCSPGPRGDAPSFGVLVKDLDCFVRHLERHHGFPVSRIHVIAHGGSGVVAAAWAHDYAPRIASLVLAAPAFECRGLAGLAPGALRSLYQRRGNLALRTYARSEDLTHDLARRAVYDQDPLIGTTTTARLLIGLQDAARRVIDGAGSIRVPVQLLIAGEDRLVRRRPQLAFFNALGSVDKDFHTFDGFAHDILGERDRQPALAMVSSFIHRHAAPSSIDEHTGLRNATNYRGAVGPIESARRAASRASMRALRHTSLGIGLALEGGLDSAAVLEHVCSNTPKGSNALGRLLDSRFLDSRAACTLRARSANVQRALEAAATHVRTKGLPVRILHLDAGDGRSVMDVMQRFPLPVESVLLCESDFERIARGRDLARARNLDRIVRFVMPQSPIEAWTTSLEPLSTIAVAPLHAAGVCAQHPSPAHLGALARAVPAGGCLVHTSGPHHPSWHRQLSALRKPSGDERLVSENVSSQTALDECLAASGFHLLDRWVDEWGVFSVSVSVREETDAAMRALVARA